MRPTLAVTALSVLLLAACRGPETPVPAAQAPDNPVEDVPPATAPAPAAPTPAAPVANAAPVASGALPAPGTLSYAGFGPATFGAPAEQVRMAWGRELEGAASEPRGCHYLVPAPRADGAPPVAFMIENDVFARVDVRSPEVAAPGGGKVGMDAAALAALYPKAESMPHKYVEGGRTLRVADPAGAARGVLVFELDGAGKATEWRVGVPPQVDYVEGCS